MKNNYKFFIWVLLLIPISIFFRWWTLGIFSSGDWGFTFSETLKEYIGWTSWISHLGLGQVDLLLWRSPVTSIYGILGAIGFDQNISDKIIIFLPSIIIANLSIFFISKKVTRSSIGSLGAAIIFNFSTYYIVSGSAFLLYSSMAFFLASFFILMNLLEKKTHYYYIGFVLIYIFTVFLDFRITYIGFFLHFLYILHYFLIVQKSSWKSILKNILPFTVVLIFFALLNIYWVLPLSQSSLLTENTFLNRGLFGDEFLTIFNALTLQHPFWTGKELAIFEVQTIQPHFWIYPFIAFIGLYMGRKNKVLLYFGVVTLLGILLTKQSGSPFPALYKWLFENIPGFNAFREASKFYPLVLLGYSVLIASFIGNVKKISEEKNIKALYFLLTISLFFIFLFPIKPILTGEVGSIYTEKYIATDYKILKGFLLSDKEFYRTLWIPTTSRWGFYSNTHPEVSGIEVIKNDWFPLRKNLDIEDFFEGEMILDVLNRSYADLLLDVSAIKYIVVPLRDPQNDDDFFLSYGVDRTSYLRSLDGLDYLKRKNIQMRDIILYENIDYRPHLYITNEIETIHRSVKYDSLPFTQLSPTHYTFEVRGIARPFFINFSEAYNPGWRIAIGKRNILDLFLRSNNNTQFGNSQRNSGYLNSFYINPKEVCKGNPSECTVSSDGTYSFTGSLYFNPQAYLLLGSAVSVTIFIILLLSFLYYFIKRT